MGRRASGERESYWRGMLARQKRSGLSVAAFCRREQISPPSFYQWRRRLANGPRSESAPQFVPVSIQPPAGADFEIRLPSGVSVVAPSGFEQAALRRLLQVVAELERGDA